MGGGVQAAPAGRTVSLMSRRRNQQVKVSWTKKVLVQRTELNDYLLLETQRPAFMTKQHAIVRRLVKGGQRRRQNEF